MASLLELPFLDVDNEQISLEQALQYLQISGRLIPLMQEIVSFHILFKEVQKRQELEVSSADLEQAIIDFRLQKKLTESGKFQDWLVRQGMDRGVFQARMALRLKFEKLREQIAEPNLQSYFEKHKPELDSIVLSCLIVTDKDLVFQLYHQLSAGKTNFEQIVQEYSLTESQEVNIIHGPTRRVRLPQELKVVINEATLGQLVGPLEIGKRWTIFRVDSVQSAKLEGQLKQELQNLLFQQWLDGQLKQLTVKLALDTGVESAKSA